MHHQRLERPGLVEKGLSNPDQIILVLLIDRHPGAQAGMDKDQPGLAVQGLAVVQKAAVSLRHAGAGFGQNRVIRPVLAGLDAVGRQRHRPAKSRMQPAPARQDAGVMSGAVLEKAAEHAVVIAQERHPVAAFLHAPDQKFDDAEGIRPPVDQIAEKHHAGLGPAIGIDPFERPTEHVELSVYIANGIDRFHRAPPFPRGLTACRGRCIRLFNCRRTRLRRAAPGQPPALS